MSKIVGYQTTPVWFVKNEYLMAKIDGYRSLLPSDHVIGLDIKQGSHSSWKIIEIQICFKIMEKSLNYMISSWNL